MYTHPVPISHPRLFGEKSTSESRAVDAIILHHREDAPFFSPLCPYGTDKQTQRNVIADGGGSPALRSSAAAPGLSCLPRDPPFLCPTLVLSPLRSSRCVFFGLIVSAFL